jgi:hypothetical protein
MEETPEHTLAFLLEFDGRVHWLEEGYWLKFEVRRVEPTPERPHGLRYALTLHGAMVNPGVWRQAAACSSGLVTASPSRKRTPAIS